jgi:hypothetical protein
MEVLTYKTSIVSDLLDNDVIINNLKETDKISDPRYIMSAGTAWLRLHSNSTLYDLQLMLENLGLNTVIVARPVDGEYKLCLPSNSSIMLSYVADFVSNPYIIAQLPNRSKAHKEYLKQSGYSCSVRYASKLSIITKPTAEDVSNMDIHTQLQWAAIKFSVEHVIVNPDEELSKDLKRSQQQGITVELRELTLLREQKERIYAYMNPQTENYISAFGILEKTTDDNYATSRLVIHLPTYLHEFENIGI